MFDRSDTALAALDTRIRELADHQRPLRLLQTIPETSAVPLLLVELGPDLGA